MTDDDVTDTTANSDRPTLDQRFDDLGNAQLVVVCGLGITIIGSVLPWFAGADEIVLGVEGGGLMTLPLAVVVATLFLFRGWTTVTRFVALIGGSAVVSVTFFSLTVNSVFGSYLTLLGGSAVAIGSFLLPVRSSE